MALETKKAKGCYPEFGHLASFMSDIAAEVNDPVYGNFDSRKEKMLGKPKATSSFTMSVQSADSHKNAKAMPIKESLPSIGLSGASKAIFRARTYNCITYSVR